MAHKIYSYSELDLDNMVYEYNHPELSELGDPADEAAALVAVLDKATEARRKSLQKTEKDPYALQKQVQAYRKGLAIDLVRSLTPAFAINKGIDYAHAVVDEFAKATGIPVRKT